VRMAFVGDDNFAVDGVRDAILLRAGVEFDSDGVFSVFLEGERLDTAAEGWLDLQTKSSLQRAGVLDR
jgi:hypothetical protein